MLKIENISKSFNNQQVLSNINLVIEAGQICILTGHNGSGKSTLLNIIAGVIEPDQGYVSFNNSNVASQKQNFSFILENSDLVEELNCKEFLKLKALIYNSKYDEEYIDKLIEDLFYPEDNLTNSISTYSKGMKKKVEFISSLITQPKVIIADEPLDGVDVDTIPKITQLINEYISGNRAIALIASHNTVFQNCSDYNYFKL